MGSHEKSSREYDGPGALVSASYLSKTRHPPSNFTLLALDRDHCWVAAINQRTIHLTNLSDPTVRKKPFQAPHAISPGSREFRALAWCKSDESSLHLLAAVLGPDVLVIDTKHDKLAGHLVAPFGKYIAFTMGIDWYSSPPMLVTTGADGTHRGLVQGWRLKDSGFEHCFHFYALQAAPQGMSIDPIRGYLLALHHASAIQVWDLKAQVLLRERDFINNPIRSVSWCSVRPMLLRLMVHKSSEAGRVNSPILAELEVQSDEFREETVGHTPHPLTGIACLRLYPLPIPFAPKLLIVAFSSQRCEGVFIRDPDDPSHVDRPCAELYRTLKELRPAQNVRWAAVRRVDGDGMRTVQLLILYSSGLLVVRELESKAHVPVWGPNEGAATEWAEGEPVNKRVAPLLAQLQNRTDVEYCGTKTHPTTGSVTIVLRIFVPQSQVQFLLSTYCKVNKAPSVFFEVHVTVRHDSVPEVSLSNNCIKREEELSLDSSILWHLASPMQQAVIDAISSGEKQWLSRMVDVCLTHLRNMGSFQPSQLKELKKSVSPQVVKGSNPRSFRSRPNGTPDSYKTHRSPVSSLEAESRQPITPPSSLDVARSSFLGARTAHAHNHLIPRTTSAVFTPGGRLVCFRQRGNMCYGQSVHLYDMTSLLGMGARNRRLTGGVESCRENAKRATLEGCDDESHLWNVFATLLADLGSGKCKPSHISQAIFARLFRPLDHPRKALYAAPFVCQCVSMLARAKMAIRSPWKPVSHLYSEGGGMTPIDHSAEDKVRSRSLKEKLQGSPGDLLLSPDVVSLQQKKYAAFCTGKQAIHLSMQQSSRATYRRTIKHVWGGQSNLAGSTSSTSSTASTFQAAALMEDLADLLESNHTLLPLYDTLLPPPYRDHLYSSLSVYVSYLRERHAEQVQILEADNCLQHFLQFYAPECSIHVTRENDQTLLVETADCTFSDIPMCSFCLKWIRGLAVSCVDCGHSQHLACHRKWFCPQSSAVHSEMDLTRSSSALESFDELDRKVAGEDMSQGTRAVIPISPARNDADDEEVEEEEEGTTCPTGCGCVCRFSWETHSM